LLLTWLLEVRELGLFGQGHLPVRVRLVVELECVISVRKVLLRLCFDFPVGFNPVKKLCAFLRVTGLRGLISFRTFVVTFFIQPGFAIVSKYINLLSNEKHFFVKKDIFPFPFFINKRDRFLS